MFKGVGRSGGLEDGKRKKLVFCQGKGMESAPQERVVAFCANSVVVKSMQWVPTDSKNIHSRVRFCSRTWASLRDPTAEKPEGPLGTNNDVVGSKNGPNAGTVGVKMVNPRGNDKGSP